jgi:hypothetical protein
MHYELMAAQNKFQRAKSNSCPHIERFRQVLIAMHEKPESGAASLEHAAEPIGS